jgi:YVTN family beta-propeller protein
VGLIRAPDVKHAEAAIFVFDANRVRTELAKATVAHVAAGCKPVRLWMQENGKRFFVTARGSDQLLVFDTQKLARIREITVGSAPVPVAATRDGARIFVGNSNRWGKGVGRSLSVIDGKRLVVTGAIPTDDFPRNMKLSRNGKTLFVTNSDSATVQMINIRP